MTVDGHGLVHGLSIDPEFLKDEKSVVAEVKLTLAVTRLRPGFRDVFLGPAVT